jgi:hypothetical protein
MNAADLTKIGIALGLCLAAVKFSKNAMVKGAAASVAAVIVAKRLPYVGAAL